MERLKKYTIVLAELDPTKGSEQKGTRPCVVLQNNLANASRISTVTIAPLTSVLKKVPACIFLTPDKENHLEVPSRLELSQIRTIDKGRIVKIIGRIDKKYYREIQQKLIDFFDVFDEFEEV